MPTIRMMVLLLLSAQALWATDSNRVILRVNDRIATLYDYELRRDERLRAIQQADLDPARRSDLIEQLGSEVLSNMLDEMLVLSRADQIGFIPTGDEIDMAMGQAMQNFGIQNEEQFEQALASSGMTAVEFRRQVQVNLRVSQVMGREVQQRVELEEEDLRRFYYENQQLFVTPERLRLQEIVVLDSSSLTADGRLQLAEEIRHLLESDVAMDDLAARHSEEGATSDLVALGWIEKGDLDPALEQAVWNLALGGVSSPVEGRGGLHLLEVLEREAAAVRPFKDVGNEIEAIERERLLAQEYEGYLRELRDAAYIRVSHLPDDVSGFNIHDSASRMTLESDLTGSLTELDAPMSSKEDDSGLE